MTRLTEEDKKHIEEAIRKAEATTSGEIVFAAAPASATYRHTTIQGALMGMAIVTAIFLLLPIGHTVTHLLCDLRGSAVQDIEALHLNVIHVVPRSTLRVEAGWHNVGHTSAQVHRSVVSGYTDASQTHVVLHGHSR